MSSSGSGSGAGGSSSKPISIPRPFPKRAGRLAGSVGAVDLLSQSLPPRAPVIGSLPSPGLSLGMPDLELPSMSPQAVSLMRPSSEEDIPAVRRVGVSSAPARTFIEQAGRRRRGSSKLISDSPTILGTLIEERGEVGSDSPALGATRPSHTSTELAAHFEDFRLDDPVADAEPVLVGARAERKTSYASDTSTDSEDGEPDGELPFPLD